MTRAPVLASLAVGALVAVAALATDARAYCRRSTCGGTPGTPGTLCMPAREGDCGVAVHWPGGRPGFGLARSAGPLHSDTAAAVARAIERWRGADCGGGRRPSLSIGPPGAPGSGPAAHVEITSEKPERGFGTFAVTRLQVAPDTGRVLQARATFYTAELAAHDGAFLESIALHETGHLFGLAHSPDPASVMSDDIHVGTSARNELAPDDIAAICAVYPPVPDRGGSTSTSTSTSTSRLRGALLGSGAAALLLGVVAIVRRRTRAAR